MRFHLKTQTFCYFLMSHPHENRENDESFSMKTQTFENALQSGKTWKRNSIGFMWTGRIHWKQKLLKTTGLVISVSIHLHSKNKDGEYRLPENVSLFLLVSRSYWAWLRIGSWTFTLIHLNNVFYTCAVEGWKCFQSLLSFSCGRVKRSVNDRVDEMLSLKTHSCGRGLSLSTTSFVHVRFAGQFLIPMMMKSVFARHGAPKTLTCENDSSTIHKCWQRVELDHTSLVARSTLKVMEM